MLGDTTFTWITIVIFIVNIRHSMATSTAYVPSVLGANIEITAVDALEVIIINHYQTITTRFVVH